MASVLRRPLRRRAGGCRACASENVQRSIRAERIGILGGGQLGRMLGAAASALGVRVRVLDSNESPAAAAVAEHVHGSVLDEEAVLAFAEDVDVLTVEVEHVNSSALERVQSLNIASVQPSAWTVATLQDKARQKEHLLAYGVPVPSFQRVSSYDGLHSAARHLGCPFLLKARFGAYDGRGNMHVKSENRAEHCAHALGGLEDGSLYAEEGVDFAAEVAVMVARGQNGTVLRNYEPVQTFHRGSILQELHAPAPLSENTRQQCVSVARQAVSALEGDGVYGVELFLTRNGNVLVNEIAPRVHNSGHHTIEASCTSQFEQHLRAVLGWPLGDPAMLVGASAMRNVIGEADSDEGVRIASTVMERSLNVPLVSGHWYGKMGVYTGRKIGHLTAVSSDMHDATMRLRTVADGESEGNVNGLLPPEEALKATHETHSNGATSSVGVIMGSESDLPTMAPAAETLEELGIGVELTVVSAHRTPDRMAEYSRSAAQRGLSAIIAGAGGAAHLPGMVAAQTSLPVIGVPVPLGNLDGMDSLLSIVQMPRGVPVATVAIGNAQNAGLLAARIVGAYDRDVQERISQQMQDSAERVISGADTIEQAGWRTRLAEARR